MTETTIPKRYTYGVADTECRYPVLLPDGRFIGLVFRWHRAWYAIPAGTETEIRVSAGAIGKDTSAEYLREEFDAGRITPTPEAPESACGAERGGTPPPLLHPRMDKPRNRTAALAAILRLWELDWTALGGYPGADNPWMLRCERCGWVGMKYWSHLRGRKGNPPSAFRHPGCTGRG